MSVRRAWGVLLGLVLALAVLSPPAHAAAPPTHLSATITNPDQVSQNGSVCLQPAAGGSCSGSNLVNGAWSYDWIDIADDSANGEPAGDYLIQVTSSTMDNTTRWYVKDDPDGTTIKDDATPVALHSGAPDLNFEMAMPTIATLSGYVKDTGGVGVAGLDVGMVRANGSTKFVKTDVEGRYSFGYTQARTYSLTVNPSAEYGGSSGTAVVPLSGDYVAPDMTVQRAAVIHGRVTDSVTGDPIPMVNVEVYTAGSHSYQGSAYTDLNGDYRIGRLGNQSLVARYTHEFHGYTAELYGGGNPVDWSDEVPFVLDPEEDRVVDMDLVPVDPGPPPEHNLSGTVTDAAGHPLAGIRVEAPGLTAAVTDRLGHWYIDAPAGTYRLHVADDGLWSNRLFGPAPGWFPEYYPDASVEAAATPVTIAVGQTRDNLDVTLDRGAYIRGTVRDALDSTTTNFRTHWEAYAPSGLVAAEQDTGFLSGASYTAFVPAGTWRLLLRSQRFVASSDVDYLPRWFGDVDSFGAATPITVSPGQEVTGKDVGVRSDFGVVSRPVVSGSPVVGAVLTASTGSWTTMTLTAFDTTWWRGPTQVGTGPSYTVRATDAGSSLRARVVARNSGHTASAESAAVTVGRLVSVVTGRGTSPKRGVVRLVFAVSATGTTPTGTLTIRRGAKVVKAAVALVGGRAVVKLKRQPAGVRRYKATYGGGAQTLPARSAPVRVKVR